MNGPKKLPIVDSTTVRASLPCACLVMTTLDEIVVGTQPVKINPTSMPASINPWLVAQALTIPKITADVIRKDCTCTNKWSCHLV